MIRINDYYEDKDNFIKYADVKSILKYGIPVDYIPDISFVIPTCKREHTLKRAVSSIMQQSESQLKFEVIIVDNELFDLDGSKTQQMLSQYDPQKISYYQNECNIGLFGNWNRCLELAKGHWVAMLHDDDYLSNEYIDIVSKILPKLDENVAIVKANMREIRNGEVKSKERLFKTIFEKKKYLLMEYNSIDLALIGPGAVGILGACSCGSLMNREIYYKFGGFDDEHYPSADAYYPERLVTKHKYKAYITSGVLGYYVYEENASFKYDTLIGFAEEFMSYINYYKQRDNISNIMYKIFKDNMIYLYKSHLLSLSKKLSEDELLKLTQQIDDIMKVSKRSKLKIILFRIFEAIIYRIKIINALIFGGK